jgi:hypothetical protein
MSDCHGTYGGAARDVCERTDVVPTRYREFRAATYFPYEKKTPFRSWPISANELKDVPHMIWVRCPDV